MNDAAVAHPGALHCRNCDALLGAVDGNTTVNFCPNCGQDTLNHPPTFWEFVHEFITHYVALEGKLWKTLLLLFFKPAELTREYRAGRKLRYISPLRLYITASFLFFFIVKIVGAGGIMESDAGSEANRATDTPPVSDEAKNEIRHAARDVAAQIKKDLNGARQQVTGEPTKAATTESTTSGPAASEGSNEDEKDAQDEKGWQKNKWNWTEEANKKASISIPCKPGSVGCIMLKNRLQEKFKDRTNSQMMDDVKHGMVSNIPYVLFLMLPLFAAMTKLFYVKRGLYYGEHVVYALHIHAFTFFGLLIVALTPSAMTGWVLAAIAIYYFIAMKRFFGGRWWTTLLRYGLIAMIYPILLSIVALVVMVAVLVI